MALRKAMLLTARQIAPASFQAEEIVGMPFKWGGVREYDSQLNYH